MNKLLTTSFLVFSLFFLISENSNASNNNNYGVYYIDVSIQNLGSENCTLIQSKTVSGTIGNIFPSNLSTYGELHYFTMIGRTNAEVYLSYLCGTYKKITLHMKHSIKKNHKHVSLNVNAMDALDVFEDHQVFERYTYNEDISSKQRSSVTWQLYQ